MHGRGVQPELYGLFEPGYSVGLSATNILENTRMSAGLSVDGWQRDPAGLAITHIYGLSTVPWFNPIPGRVDELGPFQTEHRHFQTLEQQKRLISALPKMLAVLPESFNVKNLNEEKAGGRVGYLLELSEKFSNELLSGALIK